MNILEEIGSIIHREYRTFIRVFDVKLLLSANIWVFF